MKRYTAVLLVLFLLAACAAAPAAAETTVKLDDEVTVKKGHTTISWSVSGTDSSTWYVWAEAVNGEAKQTRFLLGISSSHKITADTLMPGKKYEITVMDGAFNTLATKKYKIPKAEKFKDSKLKAKSIVIRITPVKYESGSSKDPAQIKTLKADTIRKAVKKNSSTIYGVKYHMRMPTLAKERKFFVSIFMEAPNGYLKTCKALDVTFEKVNHGYQTLWFKILDTDFFSEMYKANSEVPAGEYKVSMFWDGMLVNSGKFVVR